MSKEAMKRLTRDDTEHGVEYYRADEVDALLAEQTAQQEPYPIEGLQDEILRLSEIIITNAFYQAGHVDALEWAARMAELEDPRTSDWVYDDRHELAKALRKGPDFLSSPQPAQQQEPMTYRCAVMGEGKVAIGGCKRSTDGLPGIVYLDMAGEQREINADTTDLFPVGSAIEPSRVLAAVHFLTAESVQQSIDVLREILEWDFGATSPPAQHKPLTGEEIWAAYIRSSVCGSNTSLANLYAIARAIEAAHGIKENT